MSTRLETCAAGAVVTGGGWIDPAATGKTTFGLNVHVNDLCEPVRGQLEVVNHRTQSQHHSTEISTFESFANLEGGDCGRWTGTLRAKNGDGSWHTGAFEVEACDNGEPGRGRDTFSFTFEGEGSTGRAVLRGGNIRVRGDGNGPVPL